MSTDEFAPDTASITLPEPAKRYFRMQLQVALRATDDDGRVFSRGVRVVSLSASGIGFVPNLPLEAGDRLQLEFDLREPGASCSVAVGARVVRVVDDDFELYVGCRFVEFEGRRQRALLDALEAIRDARGEPG